MKITLSREPLASGLWIAAFVLFALALGAFLLVPTPSVASAMASEKQNKDQVQKAADEANKQISVMQASIGKRDWKIDPAKIIPAAMSQVSKSASNSGITMESFRPGRNQNLSYITIVPITITASGKYPQIVTFINDLEGLQKVNISSVQISESGQSKDQVMASITAVAYTTYIAPGGTNGPN